MMKQSLVCLIGIFAVILPLAYATITSTIIDQIICGTDAITHHKCQMSFSTGETIPIQLTPNWQKKDEYEANWTIENTSYNIVFRKTQPETTLQLTKNTRIIASWFFQKKNKAKKWISIGKELTMIRVYRKKRQIPTNIEVKSTPKTIQLWVKTNQLVLINRENTYAKIYESSLTFKKCEECQQSLAMIMLKLILSTTKKTYEKEMNRKRIEANLPIILTLICVGITWWWHCQQKRNKETKQRVDEAMQRGECVICNIDCIEVVTIAPCGHQGCCISCANECRQRNGKCPLCRGRIESIITQIFPNK
jgi:hypothetical protein